MHERVPLTQPRRARASILAVAGAAMLIATACSGTPSASGSAAPTASAAPSSAASAAPSSSGAASVAPSAAAGNTLAVEAKDFSYGLPASAQAGATHVTLTNTGKEVHQAQIARIKTGSTMADLTAALQNPDPSAAIKLLTFVGGPTSLPAGGAGSVDLKLEAGTHVFLCFIAGADKIPHIAKGMVAPLEVKEPATAGDLPAGDAKLALQDFAFVGLDTLTAGKHTVSVTNNGPQPHEATIVKLNDGVTVPDVIAAMNATTPPAGPPPWSDVGGIAAIAPASTATMDVDLVAGTYAYICFVPDPATGKAHAALGMVGALTVK
jgi:plastocyanin